MPRQQLLDRDNLRKNKENGKISKLNKRKKTKLWSFND